MQHLGLRASSMAIQWAPALVLLGMSLSAVPAAAQPRGGGGRRLEAPKFLSDEAKDIFNDIESDEAVYSEAACEGREKLLKLMAGKGEREAQDHRARVLINLGVCEFKKGDYSKSNLRFSSALSEMNLPNEDMIMQNPQLAPIGLMRSAATVLMKQELTQAGTAIRRCKEVLSRNLKQTLKFVHKQMSQQQGGAPPVEALVDEIVGYGKTGQYLPMVKGQVPMLKQDLAWLEQVDKSLDHLDTRLGAIDKSLKPKRLRLDVSKGKGKGGSLLYAKALSTEPVVDSSRSAAAQELKHHVAKAFKEESASAEKGQTLIKRAQESTGCKEDKGFSKTCKALQKVPDVISNSFGESRILMVKKGKKQELDVCTTNANIGILLAAKDGVQLTVAGVEKPVDLSAGEPVVFDFCLEAHLGSSDNVAVLFTQAWHPEFAAVERTTELRSRAKTFGLQEDNVKAATKVVNDHAKKSWEKSAKQWREGSSMIEEVRRSLKEEMEAKKKKEEEVAEANRKEEEANDEERKKNLEELERKREAKRKTEEEAQKKRELRKKMMEEERAKRDPWLSAPEVLEAEKQLEELKEARRDANAKLEFDLSTQLTKDISAAERHIKKVIKKAKKAYKKNGGLAAPAEEKAEKKEPARETLHEGGELVQLREKLGRVVEQKKKAAEADDFKEAKKLRAEQIELEAKIKKLEL